MSVDTWIAIIMAVLAVLSGLGWALHLSYRVGRIYALLLGAQRSHSLAIQAHERRITTLERVNLRRQAAS